MRQEELVDAYVVQVRPWRESGLLYRAIVRNHGWVSLLHLGARRSRRTRPLPVLTPVQVAWSGRGSLYTLRRSEVRAMAVIQDPERQVCALYVNEIISYLLPQDRYSDEIFPVYRQALEQLAQATEPERVLRWIEMDLLSLAGHALQLEETDIGKVQPDQSYHYEVGRGPCADAAGPISGQTLLGLQERSLPDAQMRREARDLMRQMLDYYTAPRKIRTRDIMRALKK